MACDLGDDLDSCSSAVAKAIVVHPTRNAAFIASTRAVSLNWLEQTFHAAVSEQTCTHRFISVSGDEDDGNAFLPKRQFPLQIGSGHAAGHCHVKYQAFSPANEIGCQEVFRRRECLNRIDELPQQVGQGLTDGLVVIDDRHK